MHACTPSAGARRAAPRALPPLAALAASSASDGPETRAIVLFTASDLAGSKAPASSGGASVFGTLGLPAALVAAIAYGVTNPALGIAARAAGGVQVRCTHLRARGAHTRASYERKHACMHPHALTHARS
jgi:hypothetical protein